MSHQMSIVHKIFLLMYKSWRKITQGKVVPLVKTNHKTALKNINFAHIT